MSQLPNLSTRALGAYGETIAARHLTERGMVLLERNWRCPKGELDLVLRDDTTVVICEVKTRTSEEFGHPLEAVTADKLQRLRVLAALWLQERAVKASDVRIDLVSVIRPRRGACRVEHIVGVG